MVCATILRRWRGAQGRHHALEIAHAQLSALMARAEKVRLGTQPEQGSALG